MKRKRCDIAIIGGGPAGVAAATRAAQAGRSVVLVDAGANLGGQIWRGKEEVSQPAVARRWIAEFAESGAECLTSARVFATSGPRQFCIETPESVVTVDCDRLILATGARELFLPFPNWTLAGVTGAGGLQSLAKGGLDLKGARIVLAGSGPLLLAAADSFRKSGAHIAGVFEQASRGRVMRFGLGLIGHPRKAVQAAGMTARLMGVRRHYSSWPLRVEGGDHIERVVMHTARGDVSLACDYLACGFGLVADIGVARHLGCEIVERRVWVDERQQTSVADVFCAGEATGIGGVDKAVVEGCIAGLAAAGTETLPAGLLRARHHHQQFAIRLRAAFELRDELRAMPSDETIVCRCEDVFWREIRGHAGMRDAKLNSRCGMGPCQGKVCAPALGFLCGWEEEGVREPFVPVRMSSMAELAE